MEQLKRAPKSRPQPFDARPCRKGRPLRWPSVAFCSLLSLGTVFYAIVENAGGTIPGRTSSGTIVDYVTRIDLAVPAADVRAGELLTELSLRPEGTPRDAMPAHAMRWSEVVPGLGVYAVTELKAGQPIPREAVSKKPPLGGVADFLIPGTRAATIRVDHVSGVEGWVRAGSRVDLVVTFTDPVDGVRKSNLAVENALVVSYNRELVRPEGLPDTPDNAVSGMTTERRPNESETLESDGATVTLVVPLLNAVKIQSALALGAVNLLLRGDRDDRPTLLPTVTEIDFRRPVGPPPAILRAAEGGRAAPDSGWRQIVERQ